MKTISAALAAHMAGHLTTLATCWKVTRKDSSVLGFTDHDADINGANIVGLADGVIYEAAAGYTPTDVESNNNLDVDNLDIEGLLVSPSITEDDLRAGVWDGATIEIFVVNWDDLSMGRSISRVGRLGQVVQSRGVFRATLLGQTFAYQRGIVELTSPSCRAQFGDQRCGIDVTTLGFSFTVSAWNDSTLTITVPSVSGSLFTNGTVQFTSGFNFGLVFEVKEYNAAAKTFALQTVPPYTVGIGDAFTAYQGCDKKFATCIAYANQTRFRGEPHLQGNDILFQVGRRT